MKCRQAIFFGALAIGLAAAPQAIAGPIPFPTGNFALTVSGSELSCSGSSCVVLNIIEAGATVRDAAGNGCGTHVAVVNTTPPGTVPPTVAPIVHVFKITSYNSATGIGDQTLTEYFGGTCQGAIFNSTGATQVTSGTLHFVVSNGRIDNVVTTLNIPGASGYSIVFTERQQGSSNQQ